jgi:hypothetical protein
MDLLPEEVWFHYQVSSYICGTDALISLLDERQWFKSSVGLGASETARDISFANIQLGDEVYEVNNALMKFLLIIL